MPFILKTLVLNALLAGALMGQAVSAGAHSSNNIQDAPVAINAREALPIENFANDLDKRKNTNKNGKELLTADFPSKDYTCPATDKYSATRYTSGQLTKAYAEAADLAFKDKTLGTKKYPHSFANYDKLDFPCGRRTMEFALDRTSPGTVYAGGEVTDFPDRLIFEYASKTVRAQFCGVIRHQDKDFIKS
ncbi:hypothetical protein BO70DRAFT_348688 [Aspergillus heteromorphus CBS 117.55]|uniref:Uncharacterized protein n=1 Tax=Aspergillus heteromorphus CBS 117.55 TaxID=1448321 RepID=A0A317X1R5_9EURO|nr:uncharacterized protein BO70DRAFT_348688 [Aspergillus heteromorphus CBS 117.55]PWY92285.1 hypothetical protein BO70DRAFT_348688 [Aspergillus heteromorphus CBS 117.55]